MRRCVEHFLDIPMHISACCVHGSSTFWLRGTQTVFSEKRSKMVFCYTRMMRTRMKMRRMRMRVTRKMGARMRKWRQGKATRAMSQSWS